MVKCIYCGKNAGFFSKSHKECELKYKSGIESIKMFANEIIQKSKQSTSDSLNQIAKDSFVSSEKLNKILSSSYSKNLDVFK